MPWNVILPGGALALLMAAWLFRRRRPPSILDTMPDVGQPPPDAEPMLEPRLQDIGFASYELPFPEPTAAPDSEADRRHD